MLNGGSLHDISSLELLLQEEIKRNCKKELSC